MCLVTVGNLVNSTRSDVFVQPKDSWAAGLRDKIKSLPSHIMEAFEVNTKYYTRHCLEIARGGIGP